MPESLTADQSSKSAQIALDQHPAAGQGEQRTADAPKGTGDELEKKIENSLKGMVRAYDLESEVIRRHHVRRFLEAEEFWKGNQHLIWSERQFRWQTPFEWSIEQNRDQQSLPRYQYVTNIYQSLGLSVIAAISQRLPKVRFQPKTTKNEIDIATARAASDVVDLIERNNELQMLAVRCAYLLWTQGIFGAWVRYVLDKDFGVQQVPRVEMAPTEVPAFYLCPACGSDTPADQVESAGGGLMPEQAHTCPACGSPLSDADFHPPEQTMGPVVTKIDEFPEGREVIDIYGGLNLKMLPTAETLKQTNYLILAREVHLSDVRAAYPLKAKQIGTGGSGAPGDNNYERYARLSLFDSSPNYRNAQPFSKHVTLLNAWLRNRAFWYEDDDEVRSTLLKRYPNGVQVVLAGDEFLEAIEDNVDDHWEICRPMPGTGMYVEAVGGSTIPIQKRYNDASNIQAEHIEFGSAPPVLVDGRYINVEAMRQKRMTPASYVPVAIQSGVPGATKLVDMAKQIEVRLDQGIYSYGQSLIDLAQFTSGGLPSIFGGSQGGKSSGTASEYAMSRAQALGRLQLFWMAVMQFWARLQLKSVECFRKNRTQDQEHVILDRGQNYVSKFIRLENLKGNVTAHPEADQDFPASWAEIRANVLDMMKVAPDEVRAMLMNPANAPLVKKVLANPEMFIQGEDSREKQFREIEDLLQSEPVPEMAPVPGAVDPATGAPAGPAPIDPNTGGPVMQPTGKLIPTANGTQLVAEPFVDNHPAHIQTIQEWGESDDGITAKQKNPAGYANVIAHLMTHIEAMAYEQAFTAKVQQEQLLALGIDPAMMAGNQPGDDQKSDKKNGQKAPRGTGGKQEGANPGQGGGGPFPGAQQPIQAMATQST